MNLDEYQAAAASTAIYPGAGQRTLLGVAYLTLGLVGEVSEIAELVAIELAGEPVDQVQICRELGDVLWYDAMLTSELGIINADDFVAPLRPGAPAEDLDGGSGALFELVKASGQVAEIVKKAIRAETEVSAMKVGDALIGVRAQIAALGRHFGFSVEAIRAANIAKLAARFASDTIKVHA